MQFVGSYGAAIIAAITDTNLFFSAFMAQAYIEARNANGDYLSDLAVKYNNFGGITYPAYGASGSFDSTTHEGSVANGTYHQEVRQFAVFAHPLDAFKSMVHSFMNLPQYRVHGVFMAKSPEDQIIRIAQAGYTTNSSKEYLRLCQPYIDCSRDLYKLGKISSKGARVTADISGQVVGDQSPLQTITDSAQSIIADTLNSLGANT